MAGGEIDIEPCDESMYKVVTAARQLEGGGEGEVFSSALVEVKRQDGGRVRHGGFNFNRVDQGFGEGRLLERRVVESVDVVPD